MATINPHTTRATGTVLTASIYNTDHQNHITNANNLNSQLVGVAGVTAVTGLVVSNGAGVISGRSLQGTGNQIVVANANGLAADPIISLPSNLIVPGVLAITSGFIDTLCGMILVPANHTYKIGLVMPFTGTILETSTICASGGCTARFTINGVNIDGAAHSVVPGYSTIAHATNNVFNKNDDIGLVISANAACQDMSWKIKYGRFNALNGI